MKIKLCVLLLFFTISNGYTQSLNLNFVSAKLLEENKKAYQNGNRMAKEKVKELSQLADQYLEAKAQSVMDKNFTPPSGSKHDYMSMGPYWWPDSSKKDGLPYIRKDGQRNPEIRKISDREYIGNLEAKCKTLSLAYYFTENEIYAAKATELLRVWFLNDDTKMNPNLNFAQAIPGINDGRGIGIIESRFLADLTDWISLLKTSKSFTKQDFDDLQTWYKDYLKWMLNSKNGKDESNAKNNHGTYYDYQVSVFAIFTGQRDLAKSILEASKKRISVQIESDGKQPLELARTNAYSYSTMNLEGWFKLALVADNLGINFWNYSVKGASLRRALDYLMPYALGEKAFVYEQISPYKKQDLEFLMLVASDKFIDPSYINTYLNVIKNQKNDLYNSLLYSKM